MLLHVSAWQLVFDKTREFFKNKNSSFFFVGEGIPELHDICITINPSSAQEAKKKKGELATHPPPPPTHTHTAVDQLYVQVDKKEI